MSKLQEILVRATTDLAPCQSIPRDRWKLIAAECGPDEVDEIHERMGALRSELNAVESWDGDTSDDIHRALELFAGLLALKQETSGHSPT
ncbi:MAG TPA: hypothetical protein VF710_16830 [Longimicrobium sp.]|jgi:hypothetical protein